MEKLILASQSPRRQSLIRLLQLPFTIRTAAVDEESVTHPDPATNVVQTARLKARAVAALNDHPSLIIAADTTVALDSEMLNKPADSAHATAMLRRLRDRTHQVHTGVALLRTGDKVWATSVATTDVRMRPYSDSEIESYVASGDPFDKAGAYAIQHVGFGPVAEISGCYANVVGLPLCKLAAALETLGIDVELEVDRRNSDFRDCSTCRALMAANI